MFLRKNNWTVYFDVRHAHLFTEYSFPMYTFYRLDVSMIYIYIETLQSYFYGTKYSSNNTWDTSIIS